MYSLDIGKFDKWVTLIAQNTQQEWIGEKEEEDDEEEGEEGEEGSLQTSHPLAVSDSKGNPA